MSAYEGPNIVRDGLVLCLDAANEKSYPGTGITWYDVTNNNINGTSNTTFPTFDNTNKAFTFNGSSRIIFNKTVTTNFSLCCWFKTTGTFGSSSGNWWGGGPMVDNETSGYTSDFGMSMGAGQVMFGIGGGDITIKSGTLYNDGLWHYAVGTRLQSSGQFILYVDNIQKASGVASTASRLANPLFYVGTGYNAATFSGSIAVIQIYNTVLTPAEIEQNFNAHRGRYGL